MEPCYLIDLLPSGNERDKNILVKGISIDSRTILKDEIYFAIEGKNYDGHNFISEAISKGACAVVYSKNLCVDVSNKIPMLKTADTIVSLGEAAKVYIKKFKNIKKVAITGSNGKTTTKEMVTSILKTKGTTLSNKGNYNNRIGLPLSIFNLTSDVEYAVFEMGTSVFGEIKILADIVKPHVGVITNVGFSHIDEFKSLDGVLKEKINLFYSINERNVIIINDDDESLSSLSNKELKNRKIIKYSLKNVNANVYARDIKMSQNKINFTLCCGNKSIDIFIHANGIFNVLNALAAASCAIALDVALIDIKAGLESFTLPKMRMDTIITSNSSVLINDAYNANPSSTKASIEAVLELYPDKQINLILGDMLELGENSDKFHFELGKFINSKNINSVSLIGDNSLNTMKAITNKNVFHAKDEESLISFLKTLQENNSVFLFKASRGMKLEKVFENFCDTLKKGKLINAVPYLLPFE